MGVEIYTSIIYVRFRQYIVKIKNVKKVLKITTFFGTSTLAHPHLWFSNANSWRLIKKTPHCSSIRLPKWLLISYLRRNAHEFCWKLFQKSSSTFEFWTKILIFWILRGLSLPAPPPCGLQSRMSLNFAHFLSKFLWAKCTWQKIMGKWGFQQFCSLHPQECRKFS